MDTTTKCTCESQIPPHNGGGGGLVTNHLTTCPRFWAHTTLAPAPVDETLEQVRDRLVHYMLVKFSPRHEAIASLAAL